VPGVAEGPARERFAFPGAARPWVRDDARSARPAPSSPAPCCPCGITGTCQRRRPGRRWAGDTGKAGAGRAASTGTAAWRQRTTAKGASRSAVARPPRGSATTRSSSLTVTPATAPSADDERGKEQGLPPQARGRGNAKRPRTRLTTAAPSRLGRRRTLLQDRYKETVKRHAQVLADGRAPRPAIANWAGTRTPCQSPRSRITRTNPYMVADERNASRG
jgi:hypothetical protein